MISYTRDVLNIGCQSHTHEEWFKFTDEDINEMDRGTSLMWWNLNKDIIKTLIDREK
jgi:hypothetical protein